MKYFPIKSLLATSALAFYSKLIKGFLIGMVPVFCLAQSGYAQDEEVTRFPSRPITFIQPFLAGSPADNAIRLLSKEAEKFLGQSIIVVNKPGASGVIGVAAIASAKPDGYTIGNAPQTPMFVAPHLEKVPYHPVNDIKMIMQFGSFTMGLGVRFDSSIKSFQELIDYARQNPAKLTYGTSGANSMQSIILEQIAKKEKVQFTHVPFKSTVQSQTALLGGHVLAVAGDFNYRLIDAKQIRLLTLFREERAAEFPQTPILRDVGYDFPIPMMVNVAGPKGIPEGIVRKLEDAFTKAMKEPAFVKETKDLRFPIVYRNSSDLNAYVAHNYATYGRMLKDMGLTAETGAIGK